jgi:hypothetical protein
MDLSRFINQLPPWTELESAHDPLIGLGHFHDSLMSRPPKRVSSVIALRTSTRSGARWRRQGGSLFVAVGRFQTEYSVIAKVAHSIAPAIVITGNVPLIRPIREEEIAEMPEDALFAERLRSRGARLWEVGNAAKES